MSEELEQRLCRCGCGASFRTMKTSRQWFASIDHEVDYNGGFPKFLAGRSKRRIEAKAKMELIGWLTPYAMAEKLKVPIGRVKRWMLRKMIPKKKVCGMNVLPLEEAKKIQESEKKK